MNKKLLIPFIILSLFITGYLLRDLLLNVALSPTPTDIQKGIKEAEADLEVIAQDLNIPWEIAFLPDNSLLITQRPGTLLKITDQRQIIEIEGVEHVGEGGLLGLALHPDFKDNHWLYLYLTTKGEDDRGLTNRVERYRLEDNQLFDKTTIIKNIPGAQFHDGGRIAFGPDRLLYITTGDAGQENLAQDTSLLNGKILRLTDDGSIPSDNPFNNPVYSYGHRNPQGITWDNQGRLWATEHGRSGLKSGFDELNLIEPGKNYGWPVIQGPETKEGMVSPVIQSGPTDTWAPTGAVYWNHSIFFTGLRGQALYETQIDQDPVLLKIHFREKFGRLRTIVLGPDNFLYLITNNTDGRGNPRDNDDQLIRLNPQIFR